MIRNYIITALRVFKKQKTYSFINILGLSVGLASAVLIGIYIIDELSYDRHVKDADRIFRVGITEVFQGKEIWYTGVAAPVGETMRKEIPEVETTVRIADWSDHIVKLQDKAFVEKRVILADSNFFEFFGYSLVMGNSKECLQGKNKIALSESLARKYFGYRGTGDASPIGKQLLVGPKGIVSEVTAVFADLPPNTHMKADFILSLQSWEYSNSDCWACYGIKTYFKLKSASALPAVEQKLSQYVKEKVLPRIELDLNVPHDQFAKSGDRVFFFVQPLLSIHLNSHNTDEFEPNGDIRYVYLFGIIAVFIILLACVNFINLTTARAFSRAKEVGIRKTVGAIKGWLVQQFLIESFLYVVVATVLAGILVFISIGPFNLLAGKNLNLDILYHPLAFPVLGAFILIVVVVAGAYPSFYLTNFRPVEVLKNKTKGSYRSFFRNTLVVFQFAISIGLIICTLIVSGQLHFIQNQNIGFQKENLLDISQTHALKKNAKVFKEELLRHSEFITASYANTLPPHFDNTFFIKPQGSNRLISSYLILADDDQSQTMGYKMKEGRFFSKEFPSDSNAVVINETLAKILGYMTWEGKTVTWDDGTRLNVIGIMKDFNFAGPREEIQPVIFARVFVPNHLAVRLTPGNVAEKVALAESVWKKNAEGLPFQYTFVDTELNVIIHSEQQLGDVFRAFTVMAVFIACLGLFGLVTFIATQRTKEIGIRKVMGASMSQITYLLSSDLLRLVIISFVIATPISGYFMNEWLQGFAYRINFDWLSVAVAGAAGFLIALATVGYKSIMVALGNPVESLKNE